VIEIDTSVFRRTESPLEDFDNTDALLRFACTVGHIEIVKSLVKIRKSPDYVCIRKSTMLAEACCCGQLEIVRELIASGADVNAQSESTHNTPLIYASTAGKLEVDFINIYNSSLSFLVRTRTSQTPQHTS
jgi:ankyrin repeat protein